MHSYLQQMKQKKIQTGLIFLALGVICGISYGGFISYDESYTLSLIRHSYKEILKITALDVHPPLYYWITKFLTAPFGYRLAAVKVATALPMTMVFFLGLTWIHKIMGTYWFSFFSLVIPAVQTYLIPEIRMYGWTAFFITLAFGSIWLIKKGRKNYYILLCISGICAAYCHYYALIAIIMLYTAMLLLMIFEKKKGKNQWICFTASVLISLASYFPWLRILLRQVREVAADYWIAPPTLKNYISYLLFPAYSKMPVYVGTIILGIVSILILVDYIQNKQWDEVNKDFLFIGLFAYLGTILSGIILSVLIRPVFSVRYVKCVLPLLLMILADISGHMRSEKRKQGMIVLLLLFTCMNVFTSVRTAQENNAALAKLHQYAEQHFNNHTIILHEKQGHLVGIGSYELMQYHHFLPQELYSQELEAYTPILQSDHGTISGIDGSDTWILAENGNINRVFEGHSYQETERSEEFVLLDGDTSICFSLVHINFTKK